MKPTWCILFFSVLLLLLSECPRLSAARGASVIPDSDPDVEFLMRDGDGDGKVTRDEFKSGRGNGGNGGEATDEAFACLDVDMNGYVTKEERDALRQASATFRSWILHTTRAPHTDTRTQIPTPITHIHTCTHTHTHPHKRAHTLTQTYTGGDSTSPSCRS